MTDVQTDTEVYRAHADELIRYATVLVGPDDAPDVVTDAVLAAFASPGWRHVDNRRAYLFRAVLNGANSFHRSTSRRRQRERVVAGSSATTTVLPDPSTDAIRALRTLSPQQRAVVYLTYWEDLTAAEIADLLAISEGSVRKQLARARGHLRKVLPRD
ncbi:MAG: RNA polymerase sigma factor [Actinomycetota bacterium]